MGASAGPLTGLPVVGTIAIIVGAVAAAMGWLTGPLGVRGRAGAGTAPEGASVRDNGALPGPASPVVDGPLVDGEKVRGMATPCAGEKVRGMVGGSLGPLLGEMVRGIVGASLASAR